MMEMITAWLATKAAMWVGGGALAVIVAWVLKRIPNEKIKAAVGKFCYGLGVTMTLGLSKWKFTAGLWNKVIEPWFIDLVDNTLGEGLKQFILGLRSDNPD
jgi:hypothetical protein